MDDEHDYQTCDCHCPQCGRRMEYNENRDDDGNLKQAWYKCADCDYYGSILAALPKTSEVVFIQVYKHPTWDVELILEASSNSREQALQNLADDATDADKGLLVCKAGQMSRIEFETLPEFDG